MPIEKRACTEAEWAVANCGKNHMCMVDTSGKKDCSMCKMGFEMKNGECVGKAHLGNTKAEPDYSDMRFGWRFDVGRVSVLPSVCRHQRVRSARPEHV